MVSARSFLQQNTLNIVLLKVLTKDYKIHDNGL